MTKKKVGGAGFRAASAITGMIQVAAKQGALMIVDDSPESSSAVSGKMTDKEEAVKRQSAPTNSMLQGGGLSVGTIALAPKSPITNTNQAQMKDSNVSFSFGGHQVVEKQSEENSREEVCRSFREVLHGESVLAVTSPPRNLNQVVKIHPDLYKRRLAMCEHAIVGRVILAKGDSPWNLVKLKEK